MEQKKIDRINYLARLAKQGELTASELAEREELRREYLADWRQGAEDTLKNVVIVEPDGSEHKLEKKAGS